MKREWRPGDVAVLRWSGDPAVYGLRITRCPMGGHPKEDHWHTSAGRYGEHPDDARPLVVIDPDDREQVERLRDLYDAEVIRQNDDPDPRRVTPPQRGNALQAALRSLVADPKPEEPTGLGAVVEDEKGLRWVRLTATASSPDPWKPYNNRERRLNYDAINAVKVLSEGVR